MKFEIDVHLLCEWFCRHKAGGERRSRQRIYYTALVQKLTLI